MKRSLIQRVLIILTLFGIVSCGRRSIDLPNGYSLHDEGKILLLAPSGQKVSNDQISQFMVSDPHVYGWIDGRGDEFFTLDTASGAFQVSPESASINRHTDRLALPRTNMRNSYTYWDIKTGHKHWKR